MNRMELELNLFLSCPDEIFVHVMYFLPLKDLGNFMVLNRRVKTIVSSKYVQNYIKNLDWRCDTMKLVHKIIEDAEKDELNTRYLLKRVHYLLVTGERGLDEFEVKNWDEYELPPYRGDTDKIKISDDVGIDEIDRQDRHHTCLFKALDSIPNNDHLRNELLKLLLACGADTNKIDRNGQPLLHYCIELVKKGVFKDSLYKKLDINDSFHLFLKHGANYNTKNTENDMDIIEYSFVHGCDGPTRLVVEYGGNVEVIYNREIVRKRRENHPDDRMFVDHSSEVFDEFGFRGEEIKPIYPNGHLNDPIHPEKPKFQNSIELSRRKSDSRLKKWKRMLSLNNESLLSHPKLKRRVRKGIPSELRGEAWKRIMKIDVVKRKNKGLFDRLCQTVQPEPRYCKMMDLDINRCFRSHKMFINRYSDKSIDLFRVLRCYSIFDQVMGYTGGLSILAAVIVMHVDDPEDAFLILLELMNNPKYNMNGIFQRGFPKLMRDFALHNYFFERKFPKLFRHFQSQNCITDMYATRWYMLLFFDILPFRVCLRFLDIFLHEGERKVLHRFSMGMLKYFSDRLMRMRFEEIIPFMLHLGDEDMDVDKLVSICMGIKTEVTKELEEDVWGKRYRREKEEQRKRREKRNERRKQQKEKEK